MLRIRLVDDTKGRNKATYRGFLMYKDLFKDVGIDFIIAGDIVDSWDISILGDECFINRRAKSLRESIDYGLERLHEIDGRFMLYDGSDSPSILGSYDVFENSNAEKLIKNQIYSKDVYSIPSPLGKEWWNMYAGPEDKVSYDVKRYDDIVLSGYNLGYYHPHYMQFANHEVKKEHDIFAVYQANHKENYDFGIRNDLYYSRHRKRSLDELGKLDGTYNIVSGRLPPEVYNIALSKSKCAVSPFGMGEICFRDFETWNIGCLLIKPFMDNVITYPNPYIDRETYFACNNNWDDLNDLIDVVLSLNNNDVKDINSNVRKTLIDMYSPQNFVSHFYNILANLDGITKES
jgi:hypothetical protein